MKSFDGIKELLMGVTEDTSLEELRNVTASALEKVTEVDDDITGLVGEVEQLRADVTTKDEEIERLKTENGRLFRERVANIVDKEVDEIDDAEKELTRDELEKMFNDFD